MPVSSSASCLGSSRRNGGGEEGKVWAGLPGKGRPCCSGEGCDPGTHTQISCNTPHTPYTQLTLEAQCRHTTRPRHKTGTPRSSSHTVSVENSGACHRHLGLAGSEFTGLPGTQQTCDRAGTLGYTESSSGTPRHRQINASWENRHTKCVWLGHTQQRITAPGPTAQAGSLGQGL